MLCMLSPCPHPLQNEVLGDSFLFPWLQLREENRPESSRACSFPLPAPGTRQHWAPEVRESSFGHSMLCNIIVYSLESISGYLFYDTIYHFPVDKTIDQPLIYNMNAVSNAFYLLNLYLKTPVYSLPWIFPCLNGTMPVNSRNLHGK